MTTSLIPIKVLRTSVGNTTVYIEVKLAKRVKYLIKGKQGVGNGQEPYGMEEGYQNNMEDEEYISSGEEEEEEDDDSDDDNIPPIPLGQPSQTTTQPTQQSMEEPTQQSTEEPTQPTQPPLCQPSQPTQEPELNSTPTAINNTPTTINRQYRRNATNTNTTDNTTNGRQEILDFLIANSEQAALESLKAAIVDVATIFLNGLRPNSNSNPNNSNSNPNNSNSNSFFYFIINTMIGDCAVMPGTGAVVTANTNSSIGSKDKDAVDIHVTDPAVVIPTLNQPIGRLLNFDFESIGRTPDTAFF
eukprot:jgi/Psemu1/32481/gm1.32481_g